jgi:hypothetical protein
MQLSVEISSNNASSSSTESSAAPAAASVSWASVARLTTPVKDEAQPAVGQRNKQKQQQQQQQQQQAGRGRGKGRQQQQQQQQQQTQQNRRSHQEKSASPATPPTDGAGGRPRAHLSDSYTTAKKGGASIAQSIDASGARRSGSAASDSSSNWRRRESEESAASSTTNITASSGASSISLQDSVSIVTRHAIVMHATERQRWSTVAFDVNNDDNRNAAHWLTDAEHSVVCGRLAAAVAQSHERDDDDARIAAHISTTDIADRRCCCWRRRRRWWCAPHRDGADDLLRHCIARHSRAAVPPLDAL